jgi:thiol-disulfide isomerase/thioredoxin
MAVWAIFFGAATLLLDVPLHLMTRPLLVLSRQAFPRHRVYHRGMNTPLLQKHFFESLSYADYVATGTEEQQRRWKQVHDLAKVTEIQHTILGGFVREMKVLVISGIWCGDCVQQCPLMERIAEANLGKIQLRFVDRDKHKELADAVKLNAGYRVPTVLFLAEDHELCGVYGDRTLSRYRAIAAKQLGASCPIGITAPDGSEIAATLDDWFNEFERIQLMLRLSARLRQKHGD